jgi:hypothetical protein
VIVPNKYSVQALLRKVVANKIIKKGKNLPFLIINQANSAKAKKHKVKHQRLFVLLQTVFFYFSVMVGRVDAGNLPAHLKSAI